ncbi:hypothetical protein BOX15_Mlig020258g1, partial [Macrostomum lignano]
RPLLQACRAMSLKGGPSATYLATLTREELINRVQQLEAQVVQLRPLVSPAGVVDVSEAGEEKLQLMLPQPGKGRRRQREGRVDFNQFKQRRVALRIAYMGWAFDGSALQDNTDNTVLGRLCDGLKRVQLIESIDTCNLVSCARTDKGVSALANVVSLNIRSLLSDCNTGCIPDTGPDIGKRRTPPSSEDTEANELDPVGPLNRVLPRELRVLAWAPVTPDFSARFACKGREYLYHFPRSTFNIEAMRDACKRFVGEHDFRNFSKFSPDQANYCRTVMECDIEPVDYCSQASDHNQMFAFRVRATAFLYHQIRNMFSVLALVGQGLEEPSIVDKLLDVNATPRKPEYVLANGLPLILSKAEFDHLDWRCSADAREHLSVTLQRHWTELTVRSCLARLAVDLLPFTPPTLNWSHLSTGLLPELRCRQHRPLLKRQLQASFEEMRERADSKRQLKQLAATGDGDVVQDEKRPRLEEACVE